MKKTSIVVTPVVRSSSEIATEIGALRRKLAEVESKRDASAADLDRVAFDEFAAECLSIEKELAWLEPQRKAALRREDLQAEEDARQRRRELEAADQQDWDSMEERAIAFDRAMAEAERAAASIQEISTRIEGRNVGSSTVQAGRFGRRSVYTRAAAAAGFGERIEMAFVVPVHRQSLTEIVRGARAAQPE